MTTRRNFLKSSTLTGIGLMGAFGASMAEAKELGFPSKWDKTADVVVAGSGIAGMSAAVTAIDNGAKVVVFEKGKNYGGCAIINGGIIALGGGTRTQKEHGVDDSPEKLYKKLTNPMHHEYRKNTPALVKHYAEMCPDTQVWLEEHGVKFLPTFTKPGQYDSQHHESYHHIYSPDAGEGSRKPQPSGGFMTGRGIL